VKTILAWHFLHESRRQAVYFDGDPTYTGHLVEAGRIDTVEPPIVCCERGLHASRSPLDALRYAPGPIICRVELSGEVDEEADKLAASCRKVLWVADASRTLREWAIWCSERAIEAVSQLADLSDLDLKALEAGRRCNKVHHKHLVGEATAEDLKAASSAAHSAAWGAAERAAWGVARSAARSAAWSAAWSAASSAASSAAWSAASSAAWSAASSVAWSAASSAAWSAAWSAAESAARSAARSEQATKLEELLLALAPGNAQAPRPRPFPSPPAEGLKGP
jgi:hypothetical protein